MNTILSSETIDPLRDERWQRLVGSSETAGIFHHPQWLGLLRDQYGYRMRAQCVTAEDKILAGLPFAHVRSALTGSRLVALPFSDSCPPLMRDRGQEVALEALQRDLCEVHLQERTDVEVRARLPQMGRAGERFYVHHVPLGDGFPTVSARFSKMAARGVARACRDGVEVAQAQDVEALHAFYRLHIATRRRQGVPTQPKRFVERFASLFAQSLGFVLLARHEGETIAAAVFLAYNGVLTYKYGASCAGKLRHHPNNAIFAEAIRLACERGMHTLDLGRTDLDNDGLRAFKRGWGAQERMLDYTVLCSSAPRPALPRARRALRSAISHTPPLTGRVIGATLYRHFG